MSSRAPTVLVVAGEASGDLHGARFVQALKEQRPDARILAVGGDQLRSVGATILHPIDELSVVGITEVARGLPRILRVLGALRRRLRSGEIDLFVPVDYPDFNFRLARTAHGAGIPVFYYIAPQVWAWRRGRIRDMARWCGGLAVLFPFERDFFAQAGIPVVYVGHPLVTELTATRSPDLLRREIGVGPDEQLVALLPGSRRSEVARHLDVMVATVEALRARGLPVRGAVARAPNLSERAFDSIGGRLPLVAPPAFDLAAAADLVLTASGTATVEVAVADAPMIVIYRLSPLTWMLARSLVKVPHVAMVNLIAGRRLVPEFLQSEANPAVLAQEAAAILGDADRQTAMRRGYAQVRDALSGGEGVGAAAERALALIRGETRP